LQAESKYRTLASISEGVYKEKGSKFIAYAVACYTEIEAKEYLAEWRKSHHQARHLCYAFRFGADKKVFRANDDGEPNNSAGAPILGQIQSFDLSNILIGVVRYFGGTKLGVGGLIHAYKTAAKEAIENGHVIEQELKEQLELAFSYSEVPAVMSLVKQMNIEVLKTDFQLQCTMEIELQLDKSGMVKSALDEIGNVEIKSLGIK
jgi:uncharacterized YigZ family protein